eukprot:TRINITY_DN4360_c0_g1_i1.p1 TRINITY_DN4360_c0_g1~~TRINITY_DN4360_c0_g1_i1.p1  ORF type:complete len:527 (-),score=99.59 TRINITY_DN4360_c0_g1_i1:52-1632(-)
MITYKAQLPNKPPIPGRPGSGIQTTIETLPSSSPISEPFAAQRFRQSDAGITEPDDEIYVIISSPAHGAHSTIRTTRNTPVSEVVKQFLKKNPVETPTEYALFINRDSLVQMDFAMLLSVYKLKNMEELIYRTKTHSSRPAGGVAPASLPSTLTLKRNVKSPALGAAESNVSAENARQFGGDLDKMEFVFDPDTGHKIPRALVQLKQYLVYNDGLSQLGVFRLAGHESRMKDIITQVETDTFLNGGPNDPRAAEKDTYTIASLIKRWFDMLKPRLFSYLPPGTVENCGRSEQASISLPDLLPETPRNIFLWLINLLCSVAELEEKNKMAPKNLAIVLAPPLLDFPMDNPIAGLELSGKVTSTLNHIIKHSLENKSKNRTGTAPTKIPPPAPPRHDANSNSNSDNNRSSKAPLPPERSDIRNGSVDKGTPTGGRTSVNARRRAGNRCPPPLLDALRGSTKNTSLPNLLLETEKTGGEENEAQSNESSQSESVDGNESNNVRQPAWWENLRREEEEEEEEYNQDWECT